MVLLAAATAAVQSIQIMYSGTSTDQTNRPNKAKHAFHTVKLAVLSFRVFIPTAEPYMLPRLVERGRVKALIRDKGLAYTHKRTKWKKEMSENP